MARGIRAHRWGGDAGGGPAREAADGADCTADAADDSACTSRLAAVGGRNTHHSRHRGRRRPKLALVSPDSAPQLQRLRLREKLFAGSRRPTRMRPARLLRRAPLAPPPPVCLTSAASTQSAPSRFFRRSGLTAVGLRSFGLNFMGLGAEISGLACKLSVFGTDFGFQHTICGGDSELGLYVAPPTESATLFGRLRDIEALSSHSSGRLCS